MVLGRKWWKGGNEFRFPSCWRMLLTARQSFLTRQQRRRFLHPLAQFCRQRTSLAGGWLPRRSWLRHYRRAMLDGSNHRNFAHPIGIGNRSEALLAAHLIDHALLPAREYGVREDGEVAKHPQKISTLQKRRWHHVSRSNRRLHLHHAAREFFNQHTWAHSGEPGIF
jgi:hypothetical protein